MTDIVEAMARDAYAQWVADETRRGGTLPTWEALNDPNWRLGNERAGQFRGMIRAAIRACHDAGGLVLREVPGEISFPHDAVGRTDTYARGHNAALAAVRAAAVEVV